MSSSTFSYAQAAKGLVATKPSSNESSNTPSTTAPQVKSVVEKTPYVESNQFSSNIPDYKSTIHKEPEILETAASHPSTQSETPSEKPTEKPTTDSSRSASPPSRAQIEDSVSTLPREDDLSSIPNASSESTWENVSQASGVAEKVIIPEQKASKERQGNSKDESWVKVPIVLKEAPIPTTNVWATRMQSQTRPNGNPVRKVSAPNSSAVASEPQSQTQLNGKPNAVLGNEKKNDAKGLRGNIVKRESRSDEEQKQHRRASAKKAEEAPKPIPPPLKDENSWPTPETAQDDRKKSLDKSDKADGSRSTKKADWKPLAITHDVVWNTAAVPSNSRRGGGGHSRGRGGRDLVNGRTFPPSNRPTRFPIDKVVDDMVIDTSKRDHGHDLPSPTRSRKTLVEESNGKRFSGNKEISTRDAARRENKSPAKNSAGDITNVSSQSKSITGGKGKKPGDVGGEANKSEFHDTTSSGISSNQPSTLPTGEEAPSSAGGYQAVPSRPVTRNPHPSQGSKRGSMRGRGGFQAYQGHHQSVNGGHGAANLSFKSPPVAQDPYWGINQGHRTFRPQRAQNDGYGKYQNGYANGVVMPPLDTTYAAAQPFQYQGHTMSAGPYGPSYAQFNLMGELMKQIEYYFSLDNMVRDIYLRKHMDSEGFVELEFLAGFKRVQSLTQDFETIKYICIQSTILEHRLGIDNKNRVRSRVDWQQWILAMDERDPSAQHNGVPPAPMQPQYYPGTMDLVSYNPRPNAPSQPLVSPNYGQQFNGQVFNQQQYFNPLAGASFSHQYLPPGSSNHPVYPDNRTVDKQYSVNGNHVHNAAQPNGTSKATPDVISNSQVENLVLMTCTPGDAPSKDSHINVADILPVNGLNISDGSGLSQEVNGSSTSNEDDAVILSPSSDYIILSPISRNMRLSLLEDEIRTDDFGVQNLPWPRNKVSNLQTHRERYVDIRSKALEQRRQRSAIDEYPTEMAILYQFWSHYLVSSFNTTMFEEFREMAEDDFARFDNVVGMHNLSLYFAAALVYPSQMPVIALECLLRLAQAEAEKPNPKLNTLRSFQIIWQKDAINSSTKSNILELMRSNPALCQILDA